MALNKSSSINIYRNPPLRKYFLVAVICSVLLVGHGFQPSTDIQSSENSQAQQNTETILQRQYTLNVILQGGNIDKNIKMVLDNIQFDIESYKHTVNSGDTWCNILRSHVELDSDQCTDEIIESTFTKYNASRDFDDIHPQEELEVPRIAILKHEYTVNVQPEDRLKLEDSIIYWKSKSTEIRCTNRKHTVDSEFCNGFSATFIGYNLIVPFKTKEGLTSNFGIINQLNLDEHTFVEATSIPDLDKESVLFSVTQAISQPYLNPNDVSDSCKRTNQQGSFLDIFPVNQRIDNLSAQSCLRDDNSCSKLFMLDYSTKKHPDMFYIPAINETLGPAFDTLSTTRECVRLPRDTIDKNEELYHSTHLAGMISSQDNDFGFIGINPYVSIERFDIEKFLPTTANVEDAGTLRNNFKSFLDPIKRIADQNSHDMNIFLFTTKFPTASKERYIELFNYSLSNIFWVVAAGDSGERTKNGIELTSNGPAPARWANLPNIIVVGSCDTNNCYNDSSLSTFSHFSNQYVHILAPGTDIVSPVSESNHGVMTGTSQAAAFVAGIATRMVDQHYDPIAKRNFYDEAWWIKQRLLVTAIPYNATNQNVKYGVISPKRALFDPRKHWLQRDGKANWTDTEHLLTCFHTISLLDPHSLDDIKLDIPIKDIKRIYKVPQNSGERDHWYVFVDSTEPREPGQSHPGNTVKTIDIYGPVEISLSTRTSTATNNKRRILSCSGVTNVAECNSENTERIQFNSIDDLIFAFNSTDDLSYWGPTDNFGSRSFCSDNSQ